MKTTIVALSLVASTGLFAQSQAFYGPWKGFSDPEIMSSGFTHVLSELPLEGSIQNDSRGWSGPYWPSKKGGINSRWNSPRKEGFDYKSPSFEQLKNMSQEELAMLSPAEKFDIFLGRYDYPLKKEADGAASKSAQDWAGICHGWAPASLHHDEPSPKTVVSADGINVPFGSADIKALVSYYYAFYRDEATNQMGLRCFFGRWLGGVRGCNDDLNAGAFHIVLTNKLGLQREGFLMDKERFREVWNQPIVGYKSTVLASNLRPSKDAAKNAVREMRLQTDVLFIDESEPTWGTVMGTKDQLVEKFVLQYRLEIDVAGKIVGGEWESDERPDFIWNRSRSESFSGQFARLPELLNDK